jgi:hypothetical protein
MTPLKPLENLKVRGVPATKYPINETCAHPECTELSDDAHHCFPRSQIGNSSYFVEIIQGPEHEAETKWVIAHVAGLCRTHHDGIERHDAWIKLEDDVFVWYDRDTETDLIHDVGNGLWTLVGPLNPQPGSREGKPKRKQRLKGEARRKRRTISLRVPNDTENGGEIWDETFDRVKERLVLLGLYENLEDIPVFEGTIAAWNDWLNANDWLTA